MTTIPQEPTFASEAGVGGQQTDAPKQADYFGFRSTEKFMFPDGITWIEIRRMNEGEKKEFQDKTSSDMVLERKSGDARVTMKQGTQRHELLKASIVDWNLVREGRPVPCQRVQIGDFLTLADPRLIEDLEKAVRKINPWLMAEMTVEDIEREIGNLEEMLEIAKKREAGEAS